MKKLIIVISVFLFMFLNIQFSYSQVTQEWVQRYSGSGNYSDVANDIAVDNSGNVYVTGYSYGVIGGEDYATIKYNSSGAQQWVQRYNGPRNGSDVANSLAVDNSGNVYVTGQSQDTLNTFDYATIKYNTSGAQQWVQRYNGPGNSTDYAYSIAVDNSGNVYVTGNSGNIGSGFEYATIKYNSSGAQQWVQRYYGGAALSIAVDNSENVYVTGNSYGGGGNYATIKYNSLGDSIWVQIYNGPGNNSDGARSIAVDNSGNVYVTGFSYVGESNSDYATIKYNSSGAQQWVRRYSGPGNNYDEAKSIAVDNSGNVYVTGYSIGSGSNQDYATIKYNSLGDSMWVQRYNGPGNSTDYAYSIAVDNSGNVYVTGYSYSGIGSSSSDYATIKYNSSGAQQWVQRYNGPGNNTDMASSIAVDNSGNVYVTGNSVGIGSGYDCATIKYSETKTLDLIALIEGFYDNITNTMVGDTIRVYLRNVSSPFSIIDSAKTILDSNGNGIFNFNNAANGIPYYIVLKHRNSIETWSSTGQSFTSNSLSYDFTSAANKAYGDNQKQIDTSPLRFGVYSGDVNQDGVVDGTDGAIIDNDAYNFVTGYVVSDVTGDNVTDGSDAAIADNNAYNFVTKITP